MNDAGVSDTILPTIKILSLTYIPSMFAFPLTLLSNMCQNYYIIIALAYNTLHIVHLNSLLLSAPHFNRNTVIEQELMGPP